MGNSTGNSTGNSAQHRAGCGQQQSAEATERRVEGPARCQCRRLTRIAPATGSCTDRPAAAARGLVDEHSAAPDGCRRMQPVDRAPRGRTQLVDRAVASAVTAGRTVCRALPPSGGGGSRRDQRAPSGTRRLEVDARWLPPADSEERVRLAVGPREMFAGTPRLAGLFVVQDIVRSFFGTGSAAATLVSSARAPGMHRRRWCWSW